MTRFRFLAPDRDTRHMLYTLALSSLGVGLGLALAVLLGLGWGVWGG